MADDGEAESPLPRFGSKRCSSCLSYFKLRLALHSFIHSLAVDSWAAAWSSFCLLQLLPPSLSYWVLASSWLLYAENFYSKGQITKFFITWFFPMFIIIYSKGFNLSIVPKRIFFGEEQPKRTQWHSWCAVKQNTLLFFLPAEEICGPKKKYQNGRKNSTLKLEVFNLMRPF